MGRTEILEECLVADALDRETNYKTLHLCESVDNKISLEEFHNQIERFQLP